jgi:cellulose synthase/poly-beta-1,6-N-acetylglucosamine synthase-like glycosyltransferase
VLVPAHDEELVIERTLAALFADARPRDAVLVVADRCADDTAGIAERSGALVLVRSPGEEPGRAAARQDGVRHALTMEWDAMVMIDADSVVEPGFFDACEAALATGAEALQARSEAAIGSRLLDHAAVAASSLQGIVIPRGRDRLGLLVRLRGTGMVLSRRIVSEFHFRAPASEDLWYSLDLCLAGIPVRHVETARLRSVNVSSWKAAGNQRVRYEAGRMSAAQEFVGPLLRRGSPAALEAAWFLMTPPFALAALSLVLGATLAYLSGSEGAACVFLALLVLLAAALVVGLVHARASWRTWLGIALAPWYLPWKAAIQLRALLSIRRHVEDYGSTPRERVAK